MFLTVIFFLLTQSPQVQWARIYGGDGDDYTRAVLEFPDKGFIAIGSTNSSGSGGYDVYVFKVDSSGYPLWSKAYGGTGDDYGYSFCATSNKYLIVGSTDSYGHGMRDIFLIKIDENGDSIWTKTYGDSLDEIGYSIVSTGDGGFLICGTTNSSSAGGYDVLVMKLDSLGNEEWTGLYGVNLDESGFCVKQTADSGYVVCGTAYVNLLGYEWCLLRYNRRGNLVWDTFQGSLNDDYAYSIEEIGEKDYVIAGNFSYELYVVRADTGGLNIWMLMQGGAGTDCAYSIKQTSDNGYIIAGITNSYGPGDNNAYLIKTYPDQVGILESMINTQSGIYFNAFPSPFSDRLGIRYMIHNAGYRIQDTRYRVPDINLRIFDASGRMVRDFSRLTVNGERSTIIWDGTDDSGHRLPSWVYFVYFEADGYKKVEKVILLK